MKNIRRNVRSVPEEALDSWARAIGKVLINFSAAEMGTFKWIGVLGGAKERDASFGKNMPTRLGTIEALVSATKWTPQEKKESIDAWTEIGEHARFRNRIAHNPVSPATSESGQFVIGVIDVKKMKGNGPHRMDFLSLDQLEESAMSIHRLVMLLEEILARPRP